MEILTGITQALQAILDFFSGIFGMINNFFKGLYLFLLWVGKIIDYMLELFDYLPVWIQSFAFMGVGLTIIMLIVGRDGGHTE